MALTHLLDTSVFSQPIRNAPVQAALDRWSQLGDAAVCTSALCLAELLQGLECRHSTVYWRRYRALIENRYPVLPFSTPEAAVFAKLAAELRAAGKPKPFADLLIAATAKRHGLILATLNPRDFTGIPGLAVEDWAMPGSP